MNPHPVLPSTVPVIRMLGAQHPYAYCLRTVCPVLKRHLYEDGRTGAGLHPLFPMNKAIKQKGEGGEGGKFHVNNAIKCSERYPYLI